MKLDQNVLKKRELITELDQKIAYLVFQRLTLAEEIFHLKKDQQCPAIDIAQEVRVSSKYIEILASATTTERIQNFVNSLIRLSKVYPDQTKEKK
jgi:chorismate mutase